MSKPTEPLANTTEDISMDFAFVLASSVHDMKNSVGMLLTTLSTMTERYPPRDTEQEKFFSTLEYEAARINTELIQLLALYRMGEHKLTMDIDEHYLREVIDEQLARNHTLFRTRQIELTVECADDLAWYFDDEMIAGVLNNLLVNCARYCRARLHISACLNDGFLCVSVADDGAGYPENMLLDEPVDSTVLFSSGSTRLGLVFARRVMALHKSKGRQGRLELANGGPLGGGVVRFFLP